MSKITIKEAVAIISVSESSLRRAIKSGEISSEKDAKGRRLIDVVELERVYGQLKSVEHSDESVNGSQMKGVEYAKVIELLEEQVTDLKSQLERATEREDNLMAMLTAEQEKTKMLMLSSQKRNWFHRLMGKSSN